MSEAGEVLDALASAGVTVEIHGDRLRLTPAGRAGDELLARLRACKPAVLSLLAARRPTLDARTLWISAIQKVAATADIPHDVLQAALAADVVWINGGGPDGDARQ